MPNSNDYNLITIKISLFILSFSLYLTINGFFFSDATMHKLTIDNGKYDFIFQLPQLFYSSIIPVIFNNFMKFLSLSARDVINFKNENINQSKAIEESKEIIRCLKIRFLIFFVLCFSLMIFFWYFIACFCAVYTNTQVVLFENTFISFGMSMLYPLGLNLLPGIFRISALHSKKKERKCRYTISKLISII